MDYCTFALLYALFAPVVVHPLWPEIPEKLKEQIKIYRLLNCLQIVREEKAHEIEALAYLVSASMVAPLRTEFANVYAYLFSKYFDRIAPENLKAPKELSDYEKYLLNDLRKHIYEAQVKALKEKLSTLNDVKKDSTRSRQNLRLTEFFS